MRLYLMLALIVSAYQLPAQFHTLTMPHASVSVTETQQIGVTEITVSYSSPRIRGRDVWQNNRVIPKGGDPFPWRAGANMNTTITFSTDVEINGNELSAGTYGIHVLVGDAEHKLLFAHNHNQWGSYYLDTVEDVSLRVSLQDTICPFSEKLDFEFYYHNDSTVEIGLEWGEKRLPFLVSVKLVETVLHSFRSELRGINTYRWEAWHDAARWCLEREVNLREALSWAERSIQGGYNGLQVTRTL